MGLHCDLRYAHVVLRLGFRLLRDVALKFLYQLVCLSCAVLFALHVFVASLNFPLFPSRGLLQ